MNPPPPLPPPRPPLDYTAADAVHWGGIIASSSSSPTQLRPSTVNLTWAVLLGTGGNSGGKYYHGHRPEQPAIMLRDGSEATLAHTFLISGRGQALGGQGCHLRMRHSLVQRFVTGGQLNECDAVISDTTFTDFPDDNVAVYADEDNGMGTRIE